MKLLIVDDEKRIRALIAKYASFEGYETDEAEDGMQAVTMCRERRYDLIIMDVMMPELDGFSAVREIRKHSDTPVIMLSARGEEYDRIHGFELGIDDYVVKPFSPKELMMRVGAVLKRSGSDKTTEETVTIDGLTVNFTARRVTVDGQALKERGEHPEQEHRVHERGVDQLGRVEDVHVAATTGIACEPVRDVEVRLAEEHVTALVLHGDERTLDTHIKLLRRQLGRYADRITTLRGVGYRFEKE